MNKTLESSIEELVKEEFSKMRMSKKHSNQARLESRCQEIIYNEWGIGNDTIWKMVEKYVEKYIPNELD